MRNVFLFRGPSTRTGTPGRIRIDAATDDFCYTLERPWLDNAPFVSCIPVGCYVARKQKSPRFKRELYELEGAAGRTEILIHVGNTIKNTEGCILLGHKRGPGWVGQSVLAVQNFNKILNNQPFMLHIINE